MSDWLFTGRLIALVNFSVFFDTQYKDGCRKWCSVAVCQSNALWEFVRATDGWTEGRH